MVMLRLRLWLFVALVALMLVAVACADGDPQPLSPDASGTELRAPLPPAQLASVGTLRISAGTSPPGGGASKEVTFAVENPVPQLTSLSPYSVTAGAAITYLDVIGVGFVQGAKTVFG